MRIVLFVVIINALFISVDFVIQRLRFTFLRCSYLFDFEAFKIVSTYNNSFHNNVMVVLWLFHRT